MKTGPVLAPTLLAACASGQPHLAEIDEFFGEAQYEGWIPRAVYLVRGVLFVGDALSQGLVSGFRDARPGYADDTGQARRSFDDLLRRLEAYNVEVVCTAHAHCGRFREEFPIDSVK